MTFEYQPLGQSASEIRIIGRAEEEVKPGDLLCLFPGCRLPAILRPLKQGAYHLVSMAHCCDLFGFKDMESASAHGEKRTIKLK